MKAPSSVLLAQGLEVAGHRGDAQQRFTEGMNRVRGTKLPLT